MLLTLGYEFIDGRWIARWQLVDGQWVHWYNLQRRVTGRFRSSNYMIQSSAFDVVGAKSPIKGFEYTSVHIDEEKE